MMHYITFTITYTENLARKLQEFEKEGGKVKWVVKDGEIEVSFQTKDDYDRFFNKGK
jgi:hypothetical protein